MRPASPEDPRPDTVTLLTPPGAAAIAVVRLAGPGVGAFLARHFSRPARAGRCAHGTLRDERGHEIDDPVVVCSPAGPFADVNVHGGPWVVQAVLDLAARAGFQRGEQVERQSGGGVDSGALPDAADELERELLCHLPLARTDLAVRALLAQPAAWARLRSRVAAAAAEDGSRLPADLADDINAMLADASLTHLLHPPRVAIVGAANVGKSTLANQLFGQERSITADLPGTTRDWVGEIADIDGLAVTLVDTPGLRETPDALEREAIERSQAEVDAADLVVLVLDATQPAGPEQASLARAHPDGLVVLNKVDCPAARDVCGPHAIRTVGITGAGVDRLRDAIRRHFGCLGLDLSRPRAWTARQRALLGRALGDFGALREI
jgi:tRNA modification GTPase